MHSEYAGKRCAAATRIQNRDPRAYVTRTSEYIYRRRESASSAGQAFRDFRKSAGIYSLDRVTGSCSHARRTISINAVRTILDLSTTVSRSPANPPRSPPRGNRHRAPERVSARDLSRFLFADPPRTTLGVRRRAGDICARITMFRVFARLRVLRGFHGTV